MKSNELKAARVAAGFTQAQAGELIGCSANTYNLKENAKSEFTIDEVVALCEAFAIHDEARKASIFLS